MILSGENEALVEEFYRDFPLKKNRAFFEESTQPCHMRSSIGTSLILLPPPVIDGRSFGHFFLTHYFNKKVDQNYALPAPRSVLSGPITNDSYWLSQVFDHEVGHMHFYDGARHLLTRDAPADNECFADCYALVRHFQRFGTDTGFAAALINSRARLLGFMHRDYARIHMTAMATHFLSRNINKDLLKKSAPKDAIEIAAQAVNASRLSADHYTQMHAHSAQHEAAGDGKDSFSFVVSIAQALSSDPTLPPLLVLLWLNGITAIHDFSEEQRKSLGAEIKKTNRQLEKNEPKTALPRP